MRRLQTFRDICFFYVVFYTVFTTNHHLKRTRTGSVPVSNMAYIVKFFGADFVQLLLCNFIADVTEIPKYI